MGAGEMRNLNAFSVCVHTCVCSLICGGVLVFMLGMSSSKCRCEDRFSELHTHVATTHICAHKEVKLTGAYCTDTLSQVLC